VVAVEALRENERGDETQFTTKIDGKTGKMKEGMKLSLLPKLLEKLVLGLRYLAL
jgi:hypothetical protein